MIKNQKHTAVPSSKKSRPNPFFQILPSLLTISVFLLLLTFFYLKNGLQPADPNGETRAFVVNQGEGLSTIIKRLDKNGLIKNPLSFTLLAYKQGMQTNLQAGSFNLSPAFTPQQMLKTLTTGRQDYWLKITEGWRLEEVETYLESLGFEKEEIAILTKIEEGALFPDSYLVPRDYTLENILPLIDKNYQKKLKEAKAGGTATLTDQEALILASIIEREARTLKSKQLISGVLQNRLDIGMALQADATVQYAKDSKIIPQKYWQPITRADLAFDSLFNTYLQPGLPPAPICNPGFDSLYAAFHPTPSDYIYYITGNDNLMHYSTTLEGHNANISEYL